jgi:integrase
VHDLRHRMVVRRIQAWHAHGVDVDRKTAALATYLGHVEVREAYWYLSAVPELMSIVADRFKALDNARRQVCRESIIDRLPAALQDFFLRRLIQQRGVSARTVESYRDAFELLLGFVEHRTGKPASALRLADLDAPLVLDFLDHHLETGCGNTRTRNARLAAIHSFIRYAAIRDPSSLPVANECWPSRPNGSTGPCSATSPVSRSPPS